MHWRQEKRIARETPLGSIRFCWAVLQCWRQRGGPPPLKTRALPSRRKFNSYKVRHYTQLAVNAGQRFAKLKSFR